MAESNCKKGQAVCGVTDIEMQPRSSKISSPTSQLIADEGSTRATSNGPEDTNPTSRNLLSEEEGIDALLPEDNTCDLKRVLTDCEYTAICNFIKGYNGLNIDCELDLLKKYPNIHPLAMQSIVEETTISNYSNLNESSIDGYMKRFEEMSANTDRNDALLKIACEESLQPMSLCRELLRSVFKTRNKSYITLLLRYPFLLEDYKLRSNVSRCSFSDNNFGPYVDLKRQILGSEYETKMQMLAAKSGLHFYDEVKLRALGYDKTPDIKMILPFLYKGKIINWMESKARFGSIAIHRQCLKEQYSSYCNRFGAGVVIYWFGYHEKILEMNDVNIDITILCDFPHREDIINFAVD